MAHDLDGDAIHNQGFVGLGEAVALAVQVGKGCRHFGLGAVGDDQRRIGAHIFQMHAGQHFDAILGDEGGGGEIDGDALLFQFFQTGEGEFREDGFEFGEGCGLEGEFERSLSQGPNVRQSHAVGRQHPGIGMDEDLRHAQGFGDLAGVLPPRTAKAAEGVFRHVIAPLH